MTGSKTKRVFIGGLKTTTMPEVVKEYFSQYGIVEFVDLPEDKATHRKRGFGYVAFDDYDPVDKVTSMLLLVNNSVCADLCDTFLLNTFNARNKIPRPKYNPSLGHGQVISLSH